MEHQNSIHFIGVGGIGMSALARICLNQNMQVSGSDVAENAQTRELARLGATIKVGHEPQNIPLETSRVVVSTAISARNPELQEARRRELPVYHRSDLLAEFILDARHSVAVAGCHGKTTVSSMIASILIHADKDPTCIIGGHVPALNGNARAGNSGILVAEADESDATFLKYFPTTGIITNIDNDHMDHYPSFEAIVQSFQIFASHIDPDGSLFMCADDPITRNLAVPENRRVFTYGIDNPATYMATDISLFPYGSSFTLTIGGIKRGTFELGVPGLHNILNALPSIGFCLELGLTIEQIRDGLKLFHGAGRRFEVKGICEGITVIDDYGHHPNEIKATLSAARSLGAKRVFVIFQPHRYTRTLTLSREFGRCFADCDRLFLADIYPASEEPIPGVSSKLIVDQMPMAHRRKVKMIRTWEEASFQLLQTMRPGDVIFTMGAGNVTRYGPELLDSMRARASSLAAMQAKPAV